jgi:hypothetical protein
VHWLLLAAPEAVERLLAGRDHSQTGAALREWCGGVVRAAERAAAAGRRGRLDELKKACKAVLSLLEGRSNKTD